VEIWDTVFPSSSKMRAGVSRSALGLSPALPLPA